MGVSGTIPSSGNAAAWLFLQIADISPSHGQSPSRLQIWVSKNRGSTCTSYFLLLFPFLFYFIFRNHFILFLIYFLFSLLRTGFLRKHRLAPMKKWALGRQFCGCHSFCLWFPAHLCSASEVKEYKDIAILQYTFFQVVVKGNFSQIKKRL